MAASLHLIVGGAAALVPTPLSARVGMPQQAVALRQLPRFGTVCTAAAASSAWPCPPELQLHGVPSTGGFRRAAEPRMSLWPTTLIEFWGAHAAAWALASGVVSCCALGASAWAVAGAMAGLASTSASLAVLLARNKEEAGTVLSLSGMLFFAGLTALLHTGIQTLAVSASGVGAVGALPVRRSFMVLGVLRKLRSWHALLALGAACFALKSSNKDRLFAASRARPIGVHLPTLALVNLDAGAKMGSELGAQLAEEAARREEAGEPALGVANLGETTPLAALQSFGSIHPQYRVMVCGGDGTVSWVLADIDRLGKAYRPTVAILPLGTGNDMSRVLGWGKFFRPSFLRARLEALGRARVALIDRWDVSGTLPDGQSRVLLNNYLSVGVDARASLLWARMRAAAPSLFSFRLLAKLWYIVLGAPELVARTHRDLSERTSITCDGKPILLPRGCQGFMICNTPSYGGGSDLWDHNDGAPLPWRDRLQTDAVLPAMDDGKLEVVAVANVIHLALTLGGFSNGIRLAQGGQISVEVRGPGVPLQVDGEPFSVGSVSGLAALEPFRFHMSRVGSSLMLRGPSGGIGGAGGDTAGGAVELALADGTIDKATRLALLEKMARA